MAADAPMSAKVELLSANMLGYVERPFLLLAYRPTREHEHSTSDTGSLALQISVRQQILYYQNTKTSRQSRNEVFETCLRKNSRSQLSYKIVPHIFIPCIPCGRNHDANKRMWRRRSRP